MKLKLDQGYISYDQVGKGIPLLFIHGYPLSRKIWQAQCSDLLDIASILSIDLRGHGETYSFDLPYTMDLLAEDCKRVVDHMGIMEPVVVCGLSMGGYVTFAMYRKYPDMFRGMILTSTRAAIDTPEGKANRDATINNVYTQGIEFIVDGMLPKLISPLTLSSHPDLVHSLRNIMLETSVQGVVGVSQAMRDRPDSTPLLPQLHLPVLIVHGADDQIIPLHEAELMHEQIPGSKLIVIPGAGHLLNMEQTDAYNQALRNFLQSLG